MDEIVISSWNELNDRLYEGAWNARLNRVRSNFVYRGMSAAQQPLTTSLQRLGENAAQFELHVLRSFRKYARREAVPDDSLWNWLAVAQHHGLPTRLLDWTYSPYVALHFVTTTTACYHLDGMLWCVDRKLVHGYLPKSLRAILDEERMDVFTAEMLEQAAPTLRQLDTLAQPEFVVFFEPPSLDDRVVNQFALFSLMTSPRARLDRWLARHAEVCRPLRIPAELKWEIRDRLDEANITERVLFPGLDGLSHWLRRYYSTRGTAGNLDAEAPDI